MQPPELPRTNHTPEHMAGTHRDSAYSADPGEVPTPRKFCSACGQAIELSATRCNHCGAVQTLSAEQLYRTKNKWIAAVLALTLGGFGVHKFYLGQKGWGIVYLLFCWTFIPQLVAILEFVMLLLVDESEFNARFNHGQ
jgi:TM2 domain-containing membrane protein YozV/ribosomal protein S27AE